ncbi:MAG: methylenetetrahydrofolate reductase, partial [Acidimicrobiia bacterium]
MARIADLLAAGRCFSFEFFPPRTEEAEAQLARTLRDLEPLQPSFVSVTYGAGGTTRERTHDIVVDVLRNT